MKLLFAISGVGYGDATRTDAIISSILKRHPKTEIKILAYGNAYSYFKSRFETWKTLSYSMLGKKLKIEPFEFALDNLLLPIIWAAETMRLKAKAKRFNPDIVISDFEPVGINLAKALKKKCIVVFGYDPLLFREYPNPSLQLKVEASYFESLYDRADMVLVPKFFIKKRSMLYTYINPIIRKPAIGRIALKKKPVLVLLGGSGYGYSLAKELISLAHLFPDEQFIILGGKHRFKSMQNIKQIPFAKDKYFAYLKAAKGVITLAGQLSITECLFFKKPMLIFPIKGHIEQILNAYAVKDIALVSYDTKGLRHKIKDFVSNIPALQKKIPAMKFNGAEQAANIIIELASQKRKH